jgi:hypothetical protein
MVRTITQACSEAGSNEVSVHAAAAVSSPGFLP